MMLQSRKTSVYCSFRFTATKGNTNKLEPLETKPESASNPLQHKQPPPHTYAHRHKDTLTRTHGYHCSALFSLKTGSCERAGVVCLNVCVFISSCVGTVYIHMHMLVSVCNSPASNLIRSTVGLWLCHIYIQMEI